MNPRRFFRLSLAALAFATPQAVRSQAPPPPATIDQAVPAPAPGNQVPPLGTLPPAPGPAPALAARPTLIPQAGDPTNMDEVTLPEKPVLIVKGRATWEQALPDLRAAFARIEAELAKAGIAPTGRPLALFFERTDDDFQFDAMIPIAAAPTPAPTLPAEMRFGTTPSGKALRFVHQGAYSDVDTTFETVASYLLAKDIETKDPYLEEYVNDVADPEDVGMEVNIFVQPK